jgi:hypothetical protein
MAEDFNNNFSKTKPDMLVGICAECEQEVGIDKQSYLDKGWSVSHGVCGRHSEQFLKKANISPEKIKTFVSKNTTRDLSDPKNKPLVDWMKNPPLSPTKQKQEKPS